MLFVGAWLKTLWPLMVGGVIFATELPTCNDSTYDFFVVHRSIAHAVVGVQRIEDGGLNPHSVTRLLIRGDARRLAVRKLVRPAKVSGFLPQGPALREPSYAHISTTPLEPSQINSAMLDWYISA